MSPQIQRFGYVTLKHDMDRSLAKILDFDKEMKLNPAVLSQEAEGQIKIHKVLCQSDQLEVSYIQNRIDWFLQSDDDGKISAE